MPSRRLGAQLTMPKDDLQIPTEDGGKFVPLRRWFDFSRSEVMPLPEYDNLYKRPDVCVPNYEVGGPTAYRLHGERCSEVGGRQCLYDSRCYEVVSLHGQTADVCRPRWVSDGTTGGDRAVRNIW